GRGPRGVEMQVIELGQLFAALTIVRAIVPQETTALIQRLHPSVEDQLPSAGRGTSLSRVASGSFLAGPTLDARRHLRYVGRRKHELGPCPQTRSPRFSFRSEYS